MSKEARADVPQDGAGTGAGPVAVPEIPVVPPPVPADTQQQSDPQTPKSSPRKPRRSSPSNAAKHTPTKASSKAPRRPKMPRVFSCTDFGKHTDGVCASVLAPSDSNERKSKANALSALGSARDPTGPVAPPNAALHATRKALRMPRLPRLRFDYMAEDESVDKSYPPIPTAATSMRHPPPRTKPRLFGIQEAPVFYPTWDEFQNPMQYIQWVTSAEGGNGAAYGIVKIVPPEGWAPEFVVNQDTFRFRTRVQRLSEISAEGRAAQNYEEQLVRFHAQQGCGNVSIPLVGGRRLDVYALKKAVEQHNGDWPHVATSLGVDDHDTAELREVYDQVIKPFEEFLVRASAQRTASVPARAAEAAVCSVCNRGDNATKMLLCDECNKGMHMHCLDPPLERVPPSEWYCPTCIANTGGDYGFEDGETHSLHSFWRRCEAFSQAWWSQRKIEGDESIHDAEDRIEAEFWRLVHSTDEHVDVEYGADVHSSTHGNATPTMEQQPLSAYARSGWNLNNMPILSESLLRYIKTEISGMTVPWIYIGMMFSAFCWHNEDHYTYSINYQHWGATKTWYGVPGADAERFEEAMRATAPQLFDACPDLLLQLVTMMSPEYAIRHGARVYAVNQRPNEIVLTFPKAYHSGFNQGFNLNEAVNFALPDWVMDGLACVHRYQAFKRQPVFSHDELLVTIAQHNQQLSTAVWLQHAYRDMVDREISQRDAVRKEIIDALGVAPDTDVSVADEHDRPEAEYQCAYCKMFCYLSQITAPGSGVACLVHGHEVCGAPARWTLRLRLSDGYLQSAASRLQERASVPDSWQQRVKKLLIQNPRPPLRTLRALVQEGERINYPLPELDQLRDFVQRAEPWIERAQVFLIRRQSKKRGGDEPRSKRQKRSPTPEAPVDRSQESLLELCRQVSLLPFEAPELHGLDVVVEQMQATAASASSYLSRDPETREAHASIDDAEKILEQGALLSVDVPQLDALRRWVAHAKWFSEVSEIGNGFLSLQEVDELRAEGEACGIPASHKCMVALLERRQAGVAWGATAEQVLNGECITRGMLDELLDVPPTVAIPGDIAKTQSRLAEARKVLAAAKSAHFDIAFADDITVAIELHDRWNEELAHILNATDYKAKSGDDLVEMAERFCERTARTAAAADISPLSTSSAPEEKPKQEHVDSQQAPVGSAGERANQPEPGEQSGVAVPAEDKDAQDDSAPSENPAADTSATDAAQPNEAGDTDAETRPRKRADNAIPCICQSFETGTRVVCVSCGHAYHMGCLDMRGRAPKNWTCPFCDTSKLVPLLQKRKSLSQLPLVALLQNPAFQPDKFRFLPSNYMRLQAAVRATVEFGVAVAMRFRTGALPCGPVEPSADMQVGAAMEHSTPAHLELLRAIMRHAVGCPVDILLIADAMPRENVPTALEALAPFFHIPRKVVTPKRGVDMRPRKTQTQAASNSQPVGRPRMRSRRARFIFREEQEPLKPGEEATQYCICRGPSTGAMVMCDKCNHWFHNDCMYIGDPSTLQDKWYCPICCVRIRRRYATADVRIRDTTPAALANPPPPGIYVDYFASLHSETHPIPKVMRPPIGPQITLHLETFVPAVLAHDEDAPASKRPRVDHSAEEERQRHVRENLYRRGVTDAMMQKFIVGWNGESIIVRLTPEVELRLGPQINIAQTDPDGSQLVRMHYERLRMVAMRAAPETPTVPRVPPSAVPIRAPPPPSPSSAPLASPTPLQAPMPVPVPVPVPVQLPSVPGQVPTPAPSAAPLLPSQLHRVELPPPHGPPPTLPTLQAQPQTLPIPKAPLPMHVPTLPPPHTTSPLAKVPIIPPGNECPE
ncbi:hypothetical protein MCUN1_002977 [Malassezia cuniculi]|uniref:[histone H3]-trimethyl-L-lysine(4) demethylase n=1 Tax=Malassezia cuniculi TaxID=948313 RepID=A0AAF0JCN9_9BASI|nr:hypothetical protein MCUN1_002977 [Malassezia cuniculi]